MDGPVLPPRFTVEMDLRGETLIYREDARVATVICTFGDRPSLSPRTLDGWWYPAERRAEPMTPAERRALVARLADHCRSRLGLSGLTIEAWDEEG